MAPRTSKALKDKTNTQTSDLLKENENLKAQLAELQRRQNEVDDLASMLSKTSISSTVASTPMVKVSKPIPLPPKRPVSSYSYFMKHARSERAAELAGLPLAESSGKISEWWKSTSDKDKAPFVAEADKDKARFEKENAEFKAKKAVYDREKQALEYYYAEEEKKLALTIGLDTLAGKKPSLPDPKKKKASATVEGPKGALNSFMLFSKDRRGEIKAKDKTGKLTHTEITAQITEEWNKLKSSKAKKAKTTLDKYQKMAEEDKVRYTTEKQACEEAKKAAGISEAANTDKILKDAMQLFEKKEHEENLIKGVALKAKEDATLLKEEKRRIREEKKREKEAKAHLPKKARTAYIFFCKDARQNIVEHNPELTQPEIMKALGAAWKEATPKDKKKYETLAKKDKDRYQKEMAAVEKK